MKRIMSPIAMALGLKTPFMVTHHVTYRCNLDCDMCCMKRLPAANEMSTADCINMQRDFRKHGTTVWGYSGGEPLVREDLEQLLTSANNIGMKTVLNTNGVLLPQRVKIGKLAGAIAIGIDGGRQSHEALRGIGTFDKAVEGLETLARMEPTRPRVTIHTILNSRSIEPNQLDEVLRLAFDCGVQVSFTLAFAHHADDRLLNNGRQYTPTAEQFQEFLGWLEREKTGPKALVLKDDPAFFRALGNFPDYPRRIPCQASSRHCVIDPTGLTLPCADLFDHPIAFLPRGNRFDYGYQGFTKLPWIKSCGKQYCYTAKNNYILGSPWRLFRHFF
ncbi:radical SAM protein [Fundidesulfovibrio putealis]|uniref:radical SAM protein n=1 Tax=Fundidesulfovibrio putealis TaxID=270496 RepID=UPI000401AED7|nr:radical SAM protein [Fundidesulfovibrio putealis]